MKKLMWMSLLLYAGVVNAVEIKVCNVGADPWFPGRQVDSNVEAEYVLTKPLIVDSLNSKGKPSGRCILPVGKHVVIPFDFVTSIYHPFATREEKMKLAWVKDCGNPIVNTFKVTITVPLKAEAVPVVVAKTEPKPLLDGTDTEYGKTKTVFIPNEPEPVVEEEPYVVVERPRMVGLLPIWPQRRFVHPGYVRGAPTFIPDTQYVRSDYHMSPIIHYPEPPPYVPPPQHVIVPPTGHSGGQGGTVVPPGGYSGGNGNGSSIVPPGGYSGR